MAVNAAIELKNVDLSFGSNQILTGIDMSVEPGEFICVIGASGSGKTTLLRMIAGPFERQGVFLRQAGAETLARRRRGVSGLRPCAAALAPRLCQR
jgi:ABC-type Fe3+/spermidine/putrescine transport system ATPase subunit